MRSSNKLDKNGKTQPINHMFRIVKMKIAIDEGIVRDQNCMFPKIKDEYVSF